MPKRSLCTGIFNDYIAAVAISAANELGLLDEVDQSGAVHVPTYSREHALHDMTVDAIVEVLSLYDILTCSDGTARAGAHFADALRTKGYFTWLTSGYGRMFQKLGAIARREDRTPDIIDRDGAYIALGGKDYGRQHVDQAFMRVLGMERFDVIADLGCGSAERLIAIARRHPVTAIGIEREAGAVDLASRAVAEAGLADRIELMAHDLRTLEPSPRLDQVDVLISFFNGHDLWPRDQCLQTLAHLREVFGHASRFLLCDTYRADPFEHIDQVPIFTLGFQVTHAAMGQYVPSRDEWLDLFLESGWICNGIHAIGIPYSAIFDLSPQPRTSHRSQG